MMSSQHFVHRSLVRIGSWGAIVSGVSFLGAVVYLLSVLPRFGLQMSMFDSPQTFLPWIAEHTTLYGYLWLLYFTSLAFLIPVPIAVAEKLRNSMNTSSALVTISTIVGILGIPLGVASVVIQSTISPVTAHAFVDPASSPAYQESVVLMHTLLADVGMQLRLTAELFWGFWIGLLGFVLLRYTQHTQLLFLGWYNAAIALITASVVIAKVIGISDLEPLLGIVLACTYLVLGYWLATPARPVT